MKNWQRREVKLGTGGLNLNAPVDAIPGNDFPYSNNIRLNQFGRPEPRKGISIHASCPDAIHSIKRLNNESPNNTGPAFTRIIGAGSNLYTGDSTLTAIDSGYNGDPLSFAIMNQDVAQYPFCYIGNGNKMAKVDVSSNLYNVGIREPPFPPSAVLGGAGLIDVGTGTPYVYAYTWSNSKTGAVSNPSPIIRDSSALSPSNQEIVVTITFSGADAQVDTCNIYRRGGSINTFRFVGSLSLASGLTTFTDNNPDLSIETALTMDTDNFVPFVSVDLTHTGTVNVSTNVVTWASGDKFNLNWPNGTIIIIDGQPYTGYGPPQSATSWNILEDGGSQTGVPFQVIQPELIAAPLEFLWGPYGGGFTGQVIFGCGDARRPGSLYWTKGNNPDSNPENNRLDICSGSETLQNGCLFDGNPFVFSTERIFRIFPDLVTAGNFYAQEVPNSKGLFARWAMAVGPQAIYFLAQDGLYMTQGGAPVSISDAKLRPLFSREGGNGETVNGIPAPDMTQEQALRLSVVGNILYFDYIGIDSTPHTLLYDLIDNFWLHDTLNCCSSTEKQVVSRYQDEGQNANQEFIGTVAHLCLVGYGSSTDFGGTLNCEFLTPSIDLGDPRFIKLFGDGMVDIDPGSGGVTVLVQVDLNTRIVGTYSLASAGGREQFILDILDPANAAENYAVYGKNISLYLTWFTGQQVSLYGWSFTYEGKAEDSKKRPSDYTDEGFVGDKRFYGVVIRANTYGVTRSVQIWADGANTGITLAVNHNGELEQPYAFAPFVCHELRLFPVDANDWQFFETSTRWLKDDYPENSFLQKDFTDQGKPGAKYFRQILIEGDTGGNPVSLQIYADGALNQTITVNQYGKSEVAYPLAPFVAAEVRTVPLGQIRNFAEHWTFDPYPDLAATYTAIGDQGKPGAKYFRELLLEGDTNGASVALRIYADGVLNQTVTVSLTGRSEVPIAVTPFLANEIQLAPLGPMRIFAQNWTFDNYPDVAAITTEYENAGVIGAKYIYGVVIEADTSGADVVVQIQSDAEVGFPSFTITANHAGRSEKPYAFAPIVAHLMRFVPQSPWALFKLKWIFDPWPENAALIPDYSDGGYQGEKFYQGFVLTADTSGNTVNLAMVTDDGVAQAVIPVTHAGKQERPYSFTPFVGHQLRLIPDSALRFFAIKWVWEPSPELVENWVTQLSSLGQRGFFHQRDCYIALQSTAAVTLLMTFDLGNSTTGTRTYTIPSTAGVFLKQYLVLQAVKGKLVAFSLTSTAPFRLFVKDCEMRIKSWGANSEYQVVKPFGGESMAVGAAI